MTFTHLMKQECGWFDEEKNSSATLTTRLTSDAGTVQRAMRFPTAIIFQTIPSFVVGIAMSMYYSIRLSLVSLIAAPFTISAIVLEAK